MGVPHNDGAYRTFEENVAAALDGKEYYVVELVAASGKVQLFSAGAPFALGVMWEKIKAGNTSVTIRLLGKGGTTKVIQNGAIAPGARVMPAAGGKVATAAAGNRTIGIKINPINNGADGDVIEIADVIENVPA